MKKMMIIASMMCLLLFSNLAAQNFEGIIYLRMVNAEKNEKTNVIWKMKNGNHRLEYTGTMDDKSFHYAFILRNGETKMKILTEANGQKVVYTSNIPPLTADNVRYYDHSFASNNKMIDKYAAEQVTLKAPDKYTVCWISKDVPLTIDMLPAMLRASGVLNYFLMKKIAGFPMEIESFDATGKLIFSQKITSVVKTSVNDDEFVVGSEYADPTKVLRLEPAAPAEQK
jgi:hypothetical protein